MSISKTTTLAELQQLNEYPVLAVNWKIEAALQIDGVKYGIANVLSFHKMSNYETRYYADIYITIHVDALVHKAIYNNVNKIIISITKAQQSADGLVNKEVRRISQPFKAFLTDASNVDMLGLPGSGKYKNPSNEQALGGLRTVSFNLIEPVVADMRLVEVGGIYRDVTVESVLRVLLGYKLTETPNESLWRDKAFVGIKGVDVIETNNPRVYDHIVVPNGTRLINLPKYLQETYGIYSTGLGWHIESGRCYLYPLLNHKEYTKRHRVLTILNIPKDEIPIMEKTFILREREIYVFATGNVEHIDRSETVQNNLGNGIRFSLASSLLDTLSETSENITTFEVDKNVRSYIVDERPDTKNNVRFVPGKFTDNPYKAVSKLSQGLGSRIVVNWDFADASLLYPGMQAKYLYKSGDKILEADGVLLGLHAITAPHSDSVLDNHFITHCVMELQLGKDTAVVS